MKILSYPHPALLKPTSPWVFSSDPESREKLFSWAVEMGKILDETPHGIALAANQVGIPYSFFVVKDEFAAGNNIPTLIVNPKINGLLSGHDDQEEGCLSFPGMLLTVTRLKGVIFVYQNIDGENRSCQLAGFPARVVQHEMEHLDGKTFLDNIPRIERFQMMAEMKKRKMTGR